MERIRPALFLLACALALFAMAPSMARAGAPCKIDDAAMYSAPHLKELARGLAGIQKAALKNIIREQGDSGSSFSEAQKYISRAGVYLIYSVHEVRETGKPIRYLHMMSFSNRGCYLATAYSKTLLAYFHDIIGLEHHDSLARRSSKGITELFALLPEAEHRALAKHGVDVPGGKSLEKEFVRCIVGGGKLSLGPGPTEIGAQKLCSMR